jgi:hypothetical protein
MYRLHVSFICRLYMFSLSFVSYRLCIVLYVVCSHRLNIVALIVLCNRFVHFGVVFIMSFALVMYYRLYDNRIICRLWNRFNVFMYRLCIVCS